MSNVITNSKELDEVFHEVINVIEVEIPETRTYIHTALKKYIKCEARFLHYPLTFAFRDATESQDFNLFQDIGDWVLFVLTFYPESIKCSTGYLVGLGSRSYDACNQMLRGAWQLYAELAGRLPKFIDQLSKRFVELQNEVNSNLLLPFCFEQEPVLLS